MALGSRNKLSQMGRSVHAVLTAANQHKVVQRCKEALIKWGDKLWKPCFHRSCRSLL